MKELIEGGLSYGELLAMLRKDLQLDASTDLIPQTMRDADWRSVTATKGYCSTAQAIAANTATLLAIDTVSPPISTTNSPYNQFAFLDTANHRILVGYDGFYYVTASASIVCTTTAGTFYVGIRQNNTLTREVGTLRGAGLEVELEVSDLVYAKRGDVFTATVFSAAADAINNGATYKNVLSAVKVG